MKDFIEKIKDKARNDPKRVVFPESIEERTLKAIAQIVEEGTAHPVLLGNESEIRAKIDAFGFHHVHDVQFVDYLSDANKEYFDKYANELYDLRKDPFEMTNLADNPGQEELLKSLKRQLAEWCKSQGDLIPLR